MKNHSTIIKLVSGTRPLWVFVCLLLVFIPFGASVRAAAPVLRISVSANRSTASPGSEIVYTLTYRNVGDADATGIIIRNPMTGTNQSYLEFISANPVPDSGNNTWIIDGPFKPGEAGEITVTYRVKSGIPSNWLTIISQVNIDSNETSLKNSNASSVFISSSCRLSVSQSVRNITKDSLSGDLINADSGDELEFTLNIKVVGTNQAANTRIWNRLSSRLQFISGSATIDGYSLSDEIVDDGIIAGDLLVGATRTVKFRAKVSSSGDFYVGKNYLRNYGYADADICMAKSSITTVTVNKKSTSGSLAVIGSSGGLTITKTSRNITKKSNTWSSIVYANPGDEIEFLIKIKSTKEEDMSVRVEDVLPPKMFYISDSTTVDGNYEIDGITTKNVYLAHVYKNLTKQIKFRVRIAKESEFNIYPISLVNEALAWGNDGKEISDSTKIIINQPAKSSAVNVGVGFDKNNTIPSYIKVITNNNEELEEYGEVKGATTIKTGFNYLKLFMVFLLSLLVSLIIYCLIREDKLLELLGDENTGRLKRSLINFYFKARLLFRIKFLKIKNRHF